MTTRVLPPEEWPRLAGTEAETAWPHLDPSHTQIVVVERDSVIVACWVLMTVAHVECLWIAPSERGRASVARRLFAAMSRLTRSLGRPRVWTTAISDDVRQLLAHVSANQLPGEHFMFTFSAKG